MVAMAWASDQDSHWTYFEALYFAYTPLIIIGLRDFHISTAREKSFFVFWGLLVVPTVTMLISNMGGTIARMFGDLTIYIGKLAILPVDRPFVKLIQDTFHPKKILNESTGQNGPPQPTKPTQSPNRWKDRNAIEADEYKKEESARAGGDIAAENIHHYHYVLFREVRKTINYATSNLPKEFHDYERENFLNLIAGEDVLALVGSAAATTEENGREGSDAFWRWSWIDRKSPGLKPLMHAWPCGIELAHELY